MVVKLEIECLVICQNSSCQIASMQSETLIKLGLIRVYCLLRLFVEMFKINVVY